MSGDPPDDLLEHLRFDVKPFVAEGGCPWDGLVLTLGLAALGSLVSAWGASHVYSWGGCGCSFVGWIIFYVVFGAIAIAPAALGIYLGKVRSPQAAVAVALLAGVFATTTFAEFRCQRFLEGLARDNPAEHARLVAQQFGVLDFVGRWGFWDYLFAGLYFLTTGPGGAVILVAAASQPFCSGCNTWKEDRLLGEVVMRPEDAVRVLSQGEIVRLTEAGRPSSKVCLRLTGSICPKCGTAGTLDVKLQSIRLNEKNEEETGDLLHVTYPGQALPVFESIFQPDGETDEN